MDNSPATVLQQGMVERTAVQFTGQCQLLASFIVSQQVQFSTEVAKGMALPVLVCDAAAADVGKPAKDRLASCKHHVEAKEVVCGNCYVTYLCGDALACFAEMFRNRLHKHLCCLNSVFSMKPNSL